MNTPSDEQLVAYLDDELDREQRSQLDSLIADDQTGSYDGLLNIEGVDDIHPSLFGTPLQLSIAREKPGIELDGPFN